MKNSAVSASVKFTSYSEKMKSKQIIFNLEIDTKPSVPHRELRWSNIKRNPVICDNVHEVG